MRNYDLGLCFYNLRTRLQVHVLWGTHLRVRIWLSLKKSVVFVILPCYPVNYLTNSVTLSPQKVSYMPCWCISFYIFCDLYLRSSCKAEVHRLHRQSLYLSYLNTQEEAGFSMHWDALQSTVYEERQMD